MPSFLKNLFCGGSSSTTEVVKENGVIIVKEIPISGNAFITKYDSPGAPVEEIGDSGMENWESSGTVWSIFFRMSKPEQISVSLRLRIPKQSKSTFKFSWADEPIENEISITDSQGGEFQNVLIGKRDVKKAGHVKINLQGVSKSGNIFAEVSHLLLSHGIKDNEIIFNVSKESYWGRRGPSVHLGFPVPVNENVEYYYNEVTVPPGGDAIGLYAMAIGFKGGYFGIQVNGPVERRVLFSVWSEYKTDDPEQIPAEYRVSLIDKGPGVFVGQFGDEGSGAQSYIKFNWTVGTTYKFLLLGKPIDNDNTKFTAWFKRPESDQWQLVASFRKPKVSLHLSDYYSFLENFNPDVGHLERKAYFGNQWARDTSGKWHELVEANFTGDATSKAGRRDFAGGLRDDGSNEFYLRHCGFFDDMIPTGQRFKREAKGKVPDINFEDLP